jgi:hypothetical protein
MGMSGTPEVGFRDSDIYREWTMRKPIELRRCHDIFACDMSQTTSRGMAWDWF